MKLNLSKLAAILEQVLNLAYWLIDNLHSKKQETNNAETSQPTAPQPAA